MASLKVELHAKKYKNGHCPVVIRVIRSGIVRRKVLFAIPPKDWDARAQRVKYTNPMAAEYNALIVKESQAVQLKILYYLRSGIDFAADDLFGNSVVSESLEDLLNSMLVRQGVSFAEQDKLRNLKGKIFAYTRHSTTPISSINVSWMEGFKSFLEKQGLQSATINKIFGILKNALRRIEFSDHKVLNYKVPFRSKNATSLSWQQFEKLRDAEFEGWQAVVRDVFVLQVYLRGTRIGEVLQLRRNDIKGDKLETVSDKTGKQRFIKMSQEIHNVIDKYKGDYLLPVLTLAKSDSKNNLIYRRHIQSKTALLNRELKVIAAKLDFDVRLTTHAARHTFALKGIQSGIDLKTMQGLLDHSSIATTAGYLKKIVKDSELDEAADKIFS